jgi:sugar lactone lactonase YvrE
VNPHRIDATHLLAAQAALGEGPVWDDRAEALWFVDITAPALHQYHPATGHRRTWAAPGKIGWVAPATSGDLVVGLADGLYRFREATGQFALLMHVEPDLPRNRLNDCGLDPQGNTWFGTMDDDERNPSGRFFRFDGRKVVDSGIGSICITNGPAVSPDGRVLYIVDTLAGTIMTCEIRDDSTLGPARPFVTVGSDEGYPDGVTCDAEGGVWLGLWGGWAARRYDASGNLTDEVRFPVANVTKVALGGLDGTTAYATTARKGLDAAALEGQPLAGDVFSFELRVPAMKTRFARLG